MYPFNTAAMDIDASLLVYLVGRLSCFPLFSFLFPPFLVVLKLLKVFWTSNTEGDCLLKRLKEFDCLLLCFLLICLSRIAINSGWSVVVAAELGSDQIGVLFLSK